MKNIEEQISKGLIDGAVVLAGDMEKDLFSGAYGIADRAKKVPMTMDTIFDIASVTKVVGTTSGLLLALSDGLLDLNRPFTDFLTDFTGVLPRPVTVRQLALHLSGVNLQYAHTGTPEEMKRGILNVDFPVPPLERYEYTCTSYILLGFLVEAIYRRPIDELVGERVFRKLRMNDTRWTRPAEGGLPRTVRTINADPGTISDFGARAYFPKALGNAGIFSTAADLAVYARMMLSGGRGIFRDGVTDCCFTNYSPNGLHPHAIGWDMIDDMIPKGCSPETVYHSGWTGQTVWLDPVKKRFVIVLTNRFQDWGEAKYGRKKIAEEILENIPA